jgi:glycosyltransferase involved in cell wall biosynthesis
MRIALVSSGLVSIPPIKGGAVEEYVYQLAKHFRKLGVDAIAMDAKWGGSSVEVNDVNGVEIVKVPVRPLAQNIKRNIIMELQFGRAVGKYLRNEEIDVVHANTAWAGFALAINRNQPHKLVYACHNPLWPEDKVHLGERVVRLVEGFTMRTSNAVVALNKTMYRAIVEKAGVNGDKVVIIPNGVDVDYFKPGLRNGEFLSKFSLEEGDYILFVGRVSPEKGVHLLLKAFSYIAQESVHVKLAIVGPLTGSFSASEASPYARAIVEYAKRRIPGKVIFTGAVNRDELRVLYSNALLLVLPSLAEAFPMVLLEAMASGIPPIGSTAGGIPDVITDGVNGLLFKRGDWKDLAIKMLTLINDETLRNKLATKARETAVKKYSWQVIASKIKEVYAAVLR